MSHIGRCNLTGSEGRSPLGLLKGSVRSYRQKEVTFTPQRRARKGCLFRFCQSYWTSILYREHAFFPTPLVDFCATLDTFSFSKNMFRQKIQYVKPVGKRAQNIISINRNPWERLERTMFKHRKRHLNLSIKSKRFGTNPTTYYEDINFDITFNIHVTSLHRLLIHRCRKLSRQEEVLFNHLRPGW